MDEMEILEHRLRDIDQRRAEIDVILEREPGDTYKHQELATERNTLMSLRRVTDNKIRSVNALAPTPDRSRRIFIEQEIAIRQRRYQGDIAQCEAVGDHYQARLWRGELLKLREQVAREFGLPS
jgi:hypothetical protein